MPAYASTGSRLYPERSMIRYLHVFRRQVRRSERQKGETPEALPRVGLACSVKNASEQPGAMLRVDDCSPACAVDYSPTDINTNRLCMLCQLPRHGSWPYRTPDHSRLSDAGCHVLQTRLRRSPLSTHLGGTIALDFSQRRAKWQNILGCRDFRERLWCVTATASSWR